MPNWFEKVSGKANKLFNKVVDDSKKIGAKVLDKTKQIGGQISSGLHKASDFGNRVVDTVEKGVNYVDKHVPELAPVTGFVREGLGLGRTAIGAVDKLTKGVDSIRGRLDKVKIH